MKTGKTVCNAEYETAIDDLTRQNRRITISETAMEMKISVGPVYTNVGDELYYSAVCARWISRRCNSKNEITTMACVFRACRKVPAEVGEPGIFTFLAPKMRSTCTSLQIG
jgi:hypothetical protein